MSAEAISAIIVESAKTALSAEECNKLIGEHTALWEVFVEADRLSLVVAVFNPLRDFMKAIGTDRFDVIEALLRGKNCNLWLVACESPTPALKRATLSGRTTKYWTEFSMRGVTTNAQVVLQTCGTYAANFARLADSGYLVKED
jgi:hypothetical protein